MTRPTSEQIQQLSTQYAATRSAAEELLGDLERLPPLATVGLDADTLRAELAAIDDAAAATAHRNLQPGPTVAVGGLRA